MGFWKRFLGIESKAGTRVLTSADLEDLLRSGGASRSGVAVNLDSALGVSTVLACVTKIANGVAQVPWKLYRDTDSQREPASDHPLAQIIYRRPNPWQTSYEFRETLLFHVLLTGNAFVFVNRTGRRREVSELLPLDPGCVTVKQNADYSVEYTVTSPNGGHQTFGQDAIWHLRGPSWNSWLGMDAVKLARDSIGLSIALERGQSEFQANGAKTSGMYTVKSKLSPEKYAQLRAWFDKEFTGDGAYRPLILDDDASYHPFTMTGVDQQLIETRKHQIEEICRAFGVMPIMVGHADKTATYASAEQMFLAHVVHTLDPWYQRIEQSADVNLLSDEDRRAGYYTKFSPNALMRGAAADRANFYTAALGTTQQPGWMTRNEVRALEELSPVAGGDEFPTLITGEGVDGPEPEGNDDEA